MSVYLIYLLLLDCVFYQYFYHALFSIAIFVICILELLLIIIFVSILFESKFKSWNIDVFYGTHIYQIDEVAP